MTQMLRFSLSSQACSQLPCKDAIALAAEAGYQGYHLILRPEVAGTVETDLAAAKQAAEEVGLGISSLEWLRQTDSSSAFEEELGDAIEAAFTIETPRLVISASPRPAKPAALATALYQEAQIISNVMDRKKAQNIEVCLGIRPQTLAHDHYSATGLLQLINQLSIRLMMDPVELCLGGADYSETALRSIQDRLGLFVLRGVRHTADGFEDVPLNQTTLYLQQHLARLMRADFQGFLLLGTHVPVAGQPVRDVIKNELRSATEFLKDL